MCVLYSALQHFNGFNTSTASTYSALQHFCTQSGRGAPEAAAEAQSLRQGAEGAAEAQGLAWADEAAMTRGAFLHFWESLGGLPKPVETSWSFWCRPSYLFFALPIQLLAWSFSNVGFFLSFFGWVRSAFGWGSSTCGWDPSNYFWLGPFSYFWLRPFYFGVGLL